MLKAGHFFFFDAAIVVVAVDVAAEGRFLPVIVLEVELRMAAIDECMKQVLSTRIRMGMMMLDIEGA